MYITAFIFFLICLQNKSKYFYMELMKFSENVDNDTKNRLLNFGGDSDHRLDPGIF